MYVFMYILYLYATVLTSHYGTRVSHNKKNNKQKKIPPEQVWGGQRCCCCPLTLEQPPLRTSILKCKLHTYFILFSLLCLYFIFFFKKKKSDRDEVFSPESLFGCLPLWTLAQVADVVEGKEETVPGGGKPREGEGGIKLLKGQFGQLGGACPGRAYTHHHGDSPKGFPHLHSCYSDAAVEPSPVGARLCCSHTTGWLWVCGAHHILPGAVFSYKWTHASQTYKDS